MSIAAAPSALAAQSFRAVVPPKALTDDTPVSIVFRGGPAVVDKWDGMDIIIPLEANQARLEGDELWASRYYEAVQVDGVPWAVAQHIRGRAIVPGTRDPHTSRKATYQIGILRTPNGTNQDPPALCEPLSEADLRKFEENGEGINRAAFLDSRRKATTMDTMAAISHVGNINDTLNAEPEASDIEPVDGEGLREIRSAELAYEGAGGSDASRTRRGRPARFKDDN